MRELRFVMLSEDAHYLVLESAEGDERYVLPADAALRDALQSAAPRRPAPGPADLAPQPEPGPAISPREIQVRVRAGQSPEELASTYGMPLDRVMRFAAAAVDERFRAHGIDADAVTWDSRRRDDGEWLVIASWLGGDATHSAEWLFSRTSRFVTPMDETAADLLSDRPIRPVAPPEPVRPSLSVAPPLAPGVVAFPPMPDAETGPLPRRDEVFDQEAPPEGPRQVPPLVPAAAALDFDEPPLPLGITEPTAAARPAVGTMRNLGVTRRDESEEEKAARARIPSWDDILLGIKRRD
jgi:hypothetical protein